MLSDRLIKWLSREQPDKSNGNTTRKAFALSTDIGLIREQNQDRVAYIRVSGSSSGSKPFLAVALSDGMGGMQNGAECAVRTIAHFFDSLVRNRNIDDALRLSLAVKNANEAVHTYAGGYGGATLSALLISEDSLIITNIGDSRIYAEPTTGSGQLKRLTRDDSMAEIVGGSGRELLQFIGMGDSLRVKCTIVNDELNRVILTSDGVHFVNQETLALILAKAPDLGIAANRLNTLVRWSGAPDNATLALLSLAELRHSLSKDHDSTVECVDPYGDYHFGWGREDVQSPDSNVNLIHKDLQDTPREISNSTTDYKPLGTGVENDGGSDKKQPPLQVGAQGEGHTTRKSIEEIKKEIARIQGEIKSSSIDSSSQDTQEHGLTKRKTPSGAKRISRSKKKPQTKSKKNGEGLQIVIEMDSNHREDSDEGSGKV